MTSYDHNSSTELPQFTSHSAISASVAKGEWRNAHIVSIRNLRLPVRTLEAGQVGTIGLVFDICEEESSDKAFERPPLRSPRIRKGMVLAIPSSHMIETGHMLQAATWFIASFEDGDINSVLPGSIVVVYVASVRASAKLLKLEPHAGEARRTSTGFETQDDVFGLEDEAEKEEQEPEPFIFGSDGITDVTFELVTCREWIELGSQVLVMPVGRHFLKAR